MHHKTLPRGFYLILNQHNTDSMKIDQSEFQIDWKFDIFGRQFQPEKIATSLDYSTNSLVQNPTSKH